MALTRITKGVIKPNENYDTHNINSTGIVTAIGLDINGNGNISGDLSVGGILTYEDVTSIDSVGIITARQGIHVGAGLSVAGISTFNNEIVISDDNPTIVFDQTSGSFSDNQYRIRGGGGKLSLQVSANNGASYTQAVSIGGIGNIFIPDNDKVYFGTNNDAYIQHDNSDLIIVNTKGNIDVTGSVVLNNDISVDGHTNLDNVSIAGVTTTTGNLNVTDGRILIAQATAPQIRINSSSSDGSSTRFTFGLATSSNHFINGASSNDSCFAAPSNILFGISNTRKFRIKTTDVLTDVDLIPSGDNQTSLGRSNSRWSDLFTVDATFSGNLNVTGVSTFSGNVHLPDNVELNLGTHNDLEIFHNDDDAYIRNNKGALILRNNNQSGDVDQSQIYIQATPAENSIQCSPNGAVTLFHDNVPQLITTTVGVSLYRDLDIAGDLNIGSVGRFDADGLVKTAHGTESAPSHTFLNDPDNGMYRPTTNTLGFVTGGDERLRITSAGKVGIGSETPGATLDLQSSDTEVLLRLNTKPVKNGYLDIFSDANRRGVIRFGDTGGTHRWSIGNGDSDELTNTSFHISSGNSGGGSAKFVITSAGAVAISGNRSQVAPSAYDDLTGSNQAGLLIGSSGITDAGIMLRTGTSGTGRIYFGDNSGSDANRKQGQINYYNNGDYMQFATSGSEKLRITSDGNLLVGTTSNSGRLCVQGTAAATVAQFTDATNGTIRISHPSSGVNLIAGGSSQHLALGTGFAEKVRITSDGDVLIGTNNSSSGNRLYVVDNFTDGFINPTDSILRIENANTSGTTTQTSISFTSKTSGSNADSAIVSQAEDASGNSRLEFWTDTGNGMTEKLVLSSTGQLSLKSNDGLYIRPAQDSADAKITFSTNNNNSNTQVGHIKYNHQDNLYVTDYGEGMIMGGTESNGFVLRVDGGINIKDSGSFGGAGGKITLGTGKDMRIYHTGDDGYIDGTGVGGLRVRYNDIIFSNFNTSGTRRVRFQSDQGIEVFSVTNGASDGARIQFSDSVNQSQIGTIKYVHSDNAVVNDSTNECFIIEGSEAQTALRLNGRFYMDDDKFVMKPDFGSFDNIPNSSATSQQGVMMRCDSGQASSGNSGVISNNEYEPFIANRTGTDGIIMRIRHQANTEGEIRTSGGTVSYNPFMGSHKAQFVDHSKPDLLIGTVIETVDQIATWKYASFSVGVGTDATTKYIPYYGSKSDGETDTITFESNNYSATIKNYRDPMPETTKHVCVKVSDTVGSKSVFGVFYCWEEDTVIEREGGNAEYSWNDLDVAAIGNYFIRMQSGQTPEVGDYVESAGDGTAKVQSDDILRSKTIAKITSTTKQKTYDDGSFLVTCTLHCG